MSAESNESKPARWGRRWTRRLFRAGLSVLLVATLALAFLQWGVPWLGRRGDLNRFVENLVQSHFAIPVKIGRIETNPLREFTATELHSVSAEAEGRAQFRAARITLEYDPLSLLQSRIHRLEVEGPALALNLDADLSGLATLESPAGGIDSGSPGATSEAPARGSTPLVIDSALVRSGRLDVQLGGRTLVLHSLELRLRNLGRSGPQRFDLRVRVLGGSCRIVGSIAKIGPDAYRISRAQISGSHLPLGELLAWAGSEHWLRPLTSSSDRGAEILTSALARNPRTRISGRVSGTWPDALEVELQANAAATAADAEPVALADGQLARLDEISVQMNATAANALARTRFSARVTASGRVARIRAPEAVSVEVTGRGEYTRGERGGELRLESLAARSGDVWLRAHGTIDGLERAAPNHELEFAASLDEAFVREFERSSDLDLVSGPVEINGRVVGDAARLAVTATAFVPTRGGAVARVSVEDAAVSSSRSSIEIAAGSIAFLDAFPAEALSDSLSSHLPATNSLAFDAGLLSAESLFCDVRGSEIGWSGTIAASANLTRGHVRAAADWFEAAGVDGALELDASVDYRVAPPRARVVYDARARIEIDEFIAGAVGAGMSDEWSTAELSGEFDWSAETTETRALRILALDVETPITGRSTGSIALDWSAGGSSVPSPRLTIDLRTRAVPLSRAYRAFVVDPLSPSFGWLESSRLDGELELDWRYSRALGDTARGEHFGEARLDAGEWSAGGTALSGVSLSLPFESQSAGEPAARARARNGHLAISRIGGETWSVGPIASPVRLYEGVYGLVEPQRLRLFGGVLDVSALDLFLRSKGGPTWRTVVRANDLDLAEILRAADLPPVAGRVSAVARPAHFRGQRLEWNGSIDCRAFGGEIRFEDLAVEDPLKPYVSLELRSGRLRDLDLKALGETFQFGLFSGVLSGRVDGVEIVGGELAAFRVSVATERKKGVRQYVDRRAIESIRRVLEGPLGDVEESLFSRFYYDRFGFDASLANGRFRLRGKYRENGKEGIMLGEWYRLPRISIINANPGIDYDWEAISASLRAIYEGED